MPTKKAHPSYRKAYCHTASRHVKAGGTGNPKLVKCTAKSKSKYRKHTKKAVVVD